MEEGKHRMVIDSSGTSLRRSLSELKAYKDLFWILAYRDLKARYAQTALGFIWAFFKPLTTLIVYTFVFNRVAGLGTGDIAYPVYAMSGMALWTLISSSLTGSSGALRQASGMIKKIYFPRVVLPTSRFLVNLVDFSINMLILAALMIYHQQAVGLNILLAPVYIILTGVFSISLAFFFGGMSVRYRDFLTLLPMLVQLGTYLTPIAYPIEQVPEKYLTFYMLNPVTCIVQGFRFCLFDVEINWYFQGYLLVVCTVLFFVGFSYFNKVQKNVADII